MSVVGMVGKRVNPRQAVVIIVVRLGPVKSHLDKNSMWLFPLHPPSLVIILSLYCFFL